MFGRGFVTEYNANCQSLRIDNGLAVGQLIRTGSVCTTTAADATVAP